MKITKNDSSKSALVLTIEIPASDLKPYLEKAAKEISQHLKIDGFRPGFAPYEVVKGKVGEMEIYQTATDEIINKTLFQALEQEAKDVDVVGQPDVKVDKLVPGNDFVYTATIMLVPTVKLGDYKQIKVSRKTVTADMKRVEQTLDNLRRMKAKELPKLGAIANGDKAIINFNLFVDRVPLEGGQAQSYPLLVGEGSFIPGFEEQLIGLNKGEKKEFSLAFPKDYHDQKIAGKLADFKIEVVDVQKIELPELNDELAKDFGHDTVEQLKTAVTDSLKQEDEKKEDQRLELAILEELVKKSEFGEINEKLITDEARVMVHELEHSIGQQGLSFADYLTHIKKTEEDLLKDFRPQAENRIKTALCLRAVSTQENITVSDKDIDEEIAKLERMLAVSNPAARDQLKTPAYRRYLDTTIKNRKTVEAIVSQAVVK